MLKRFIRWELRRALTAASISALVLAFAATAAAQNASPTPSVPNQASPSQTQQQQSTTTPSTEAQSTAAANQTATQAAATSVGQTVAATGTVEPLYREYRGVKLGMSAADVRAKLGKPAEKSDEMDFYVFSDKERARVYYQDGKASAIIATYMGQNSGAPAPLAVLGTDIEAKPDGSLYRMTPYPQAGYWVAYSRTPGDSSMVIITMQKSR